MVITHGPQLGSTPKCINTMASRKETEENLGDDSENLYGYIKARLKFGLMGFTFFFKKIDTS